MSQILERWPWQPSSSSAHKMAKKTEQCEQCDSLRPPQVRLVLWPSEEFPSSEQPQQQQQPSQQRVVVSKPKKMWAKLPLRQIPSSLKMGWLSSGEAGGGANGPKHHNNAVFRSNSFRFERPPPEDDAQMYRSGPVKSNSITAQDIATLNDKYEMPKDYVNRRPLRPLLTPKYQRRIKGFYEGVHVNTLESSPVDVVYSDPKDSKLYQMPGGDPVRRPTGNDDVLYKVYVSGGRESQYCRPYVTMRPPTTMSPSFQSDRDVYEEVNTANNNCVTMITVMPGTFRSRRTVNSSPIEAADSTSLAPSTRESEETSSSEGGSFIIDSTAFYENLNFHRLIVRPPATAQTSSDDLTLETSKFGYSQKEVWNWLYTDHDMNHNHKASKSLMAQPISQVTKRQDKAVEVKFTLSEFVNCYKRLLSLNLEGFTEFVNRTLETLISTTTAYHQMAKNSHANNFMSISRNPNCCQQQKSKILMVPSLHRSNKTYVRLSVRRPHDHITPAAFTCYQTLIDVSNSGGESIVEDMIPPHLTGKSQLPIDLSLPLDRQEWYHGSITRHEAENALRLHEEGSFLVRNSESSSNDYSLSVKTARGFMHMKIQERHGQGYILGQFSNPFRTIAQMLLYYNRNSLPVKGAEHMTLKKPVCEQLL